MSGSMETRACIEASIFVLLSCTWEKLGKEREKQNRWHSQSPQKQSHLTPRLSRGSRWQELPVPQTHPTVQERQSFQRRCADFSLPDFPCAGGQSLWSRTIQSRGKRLGEEQLQLCFDNSRITFIKPTFNFVFICAVTVLCWYLRVQTITSRLTGFFG